MAAVTTVLAVGATLYAGKKQQKMYNKQAAEAQIRGRSEAIAYKQKGANALSMLNETLAAITARAGAGGVDPTSGSAATLQSYAMGEGVREFNIAADNSILALGQASAQAGIYRSSGKLARLNSYVTAIGQIQDTAKRAMDAR